MFYTKNEYKNEISNFLKRNGMLIKLTNHENKIIGNLLRYEISNNDNNASVFINVSLFSDYENSSKKISYKNLKYFGIKHMFKIEDKALKKFSYNLNDENFLNDFNFYLQNKIDENEIIKFIINKVLIIKDYYKNKNINVFFI